MMGRRYPALWGIGLSLLVSQPALAEPSPPTPQAPCQTEAADTGYFVKRMDAAIDGLEKFSGRVIVARCGDILYDRSSGYADRISGFPIDERTVFDLGSLTKPLTATAILHLEDAGRLSVENRLGDYIANLPPRMAEITIRQMLTHTGGLPENPWEDGERVSWAEFLDWLRASELDFAPGTGWAYSNTGYSLLAMIVEQTAAVTLEAYWRSAFLDLLGIEELGYRWPRGPLAASYLPDGETIGTQLEGAWAPDGPYPNLRGNGGVIGTPEAFLRWFFALYDGRILSERNTQAMFTAQTGTGTPDRAYGYGWRLATGEDSEWIYHGGSNGASFYNQLRHDPQSAMTLMLSMNIFDPEAIRAILSVFQDADEWMRRNQETSHLSPKFSG